MSANNISNRKIDRLAYLHRTAQYMHCRHQRQRIERIARNWRVYIRMMAAVDRQRALVSRRRYRARTISVASYAIAMAEARIRSIMARCMPTARGAGDRYIAVHITRGLQSPNYDHTVSPRWISPYRYPARDHYYTLWIAPGHQVVAINGVLTIARRGTICREGYQAWWLEPSRGYGHRVVSGYVVRGTHVRARSLQHAQRIVARRRAESARQLLAQRVQRHNLKYIWVTRDDSIAAGNCAAGTDAAISRLSDCLGGTPGAVRADWLLAAAADAGISISGVRRAIAAATQRYAAPAAVAA